jgi:hypothetical protein
MKIFLVSLAIFALCALIHAQPPMMQEKIDKAADFINNFQGTKEELEKTLIEKMNTRMNNAHQHMPKEAVAKFIDSVAEKLNGKMMGGDEFKEFVKKNMKNLD